MLTALLADGPVLQRATVLSPPAQTVRGRGRWIVAAGLVVLLAVGGAGWVWWSRVTPPSPARVAAAPPIFPAAPRGQDEFPSANVPAESVPSAALSPDLAVSNPPISPPANAADEPPEPPVSALTVVPAPVAQVVAARPDPRVLLNQRLVSFQQPKPVSRRALLGTIEDLLDRPVHVRDDVPADVAARLDAAVTLALENVTVEELLRSILNGTGLEFTCTADDVKLHVAKP